MKKTLLLCSIILLGNWPDYAAACINSNTSASCPNPSDLTLGSSLDCPAAQFVAMSGDVQSALGGCTDPTVPTATASPTAVCEGSTTTLSISGSLNDATAWHVYTGLCGGTEIGTTAGSTLVVTPTSPSTEYFIRGEGGCVVPGICGTITVTVNLTPSTPTISAGGETTFCTGGSVTLTSSSATGNQWSLDGTPIAGETNETYTANATGNYTVVVTTSGCVSNASSAAFVSVSTASFETSTIKVIITPDRYGGETTWELTNSSGALLGAGGPYATIATNTTQPDEIEVITIQDFGECYTFTIRDSYGDGICCAYGAGKYRLEDASDNLLVNGFGDFGDETAYYFQITSPPHNWTGAVSTDWNNSANWLGGEIPDATNNVIIPSAPSIQPHVTSNPGTPALCADLTVESGATLSVDAGKALTVSGTLANAGTVDIKASTIGIGSLITNGAVTGAGTFNMEQYLTGSGGGTPDGLFYYVSSPTGFATGNVYNAAGTDNVWSADESTQTYPDITDNSTGLSVAKGYVVRLGATGTKTFTGGAFNTGSITEGSLTRTGTTATNRGYNLVGNPYTSTINWDDLTKANLETTMYYRTHNGSTMLMDTYNATGSVGTSNNGTTVTGAIPPTQAFWVRVPTDGLIGSVTFDNADRSHGTATSIYKVAAEEGTVRIALSDGNVSDEQIVMFNPSAQASYDAYDSQKFWSINVPQLYSNLAEDTLTINGLNNPVFTPTVDLGMKVPAQGEYTLNATSITLTETPVHLEDRVLGVFQDLNAEPNYAFTSNAGNIGDRFALHFNMSVTGLNEAENNINVFSIANAVNVNLSNAETGTITVLDMSGRMVHNQAINSDRMVINLNTAAGIYVVQVETSAQTITKKISIQ